MGAKRLSAESDVLWRSARIANRLLRDKRSGPNQADQFAHGESTWTGTLYTGRAIAALGPFRLSGCPRGSLSRDRNGRRIQVIAFVLGDLDRGRPEEIVIRFASCLGGGTLDHLPADLKTDHPLLLLRVPVYGCVADFHHGTFLHEGLRNGLLLLVLSGDLRAEATVRFPAYA